MRKFTIAEISIAAEIATFMTWNCYATVALWVSHNDDRRLFQETIISFLERNIYVPGHGEIPPAKIVRKLVSQIELETSTSLFILPMTNTAKGRTITRAYIPKRLPKREAELNDLLVCFAPTLAYGGTLIRY